LDLAETIQASYFPGIEMETFINGIGVISPQKTFMESGFLQEVMDYQEVSFLKCIEPPYNTYLDPMASRRMSRIVKMGVCGASQCIQDAAIEIPDAIITGTGLGCIEDTEKFLSSVFLNNENLLNPTPFIQSTHNSVAAAIALKIKCYNYNSTYVHRGFSFESALLDGLMLLMEKSAKNVLIGSVDEVTQNSYSLTKRLGFWKKQPIKNLKLLENKTKGSLAGEGIAFFMLSQFQRENTYAKINSIRTLYKPESTATIENQLSDFIHKAGLTVYDIDLLILGLNGDPGQDKIYYHLVGNQFNNKPCACFKHLCGEYDTSSSFALYLASKILKEQIVPDILCLGDKPQRKIRNILIYNHLRNLNHSFFLLSNADL
jgi:3-oxoacyl-[acyl-carrier-protein] synthase II